MRVLIGCETSGVMRRNNMASPAVHAAPTEQAAKDALLAAWLDFVRAAGLQVVEGGE